MSPFVRFSAYTSPRRAQAGIGMVELMVAVLLGAVLTIGVIQMFTASKQTFRMQDAMSLTNEAGTFVVDFIARDLVRAGATDDITNDDNNDAFALANTVEGGAGANDELTVAYQMNTRSFPLGTVPYCTGVPVPAGTEYIANHYWVDANDRLMCEGMQRVAVGVYVPATPAEVMVDNVESFQVLYGVDTAHPDCNVTTRTTEATLYVTANRINEAVARATAACVGINPILDREVVRSARIGLLLRTEGNAGARVDNATSYTVLNETLGAPDINPGDGRLRRFFTRTVVLRNLAEGMQ